MFVNTIHTKMFVALVALGLSVDSVSGSSLLRAPATYAFVASLCAGYNRPVNVLTKQFTEQNPLQLHEQRMVQNSLIGGLLSYTAWIAVAYLRGANKYMPDLNPTLFFAPWAGAAAGHYILHNGTQLYLNAGQWNKALQDSAYLEKRIDKVQEGEKRQLEAQFASAGRTIIRCEEQSEKLKDAIIKYGGGNLLIGGAVVYGSPYLFALGMRTLGYK